MIKSVGRPTKLTDELQEEICKYLRSGNYVETVSALVGINKTTFYDWLKKGSRAKRSDSKHAKFSNAVKRAMAESEARDVALIGQAANTQWQAAAWRLERKHPAKWGRKDFVGMKELPDDERGKIDFSRLSNDEIGILESLVDKVDNG